MYRAEVTISANHDGRRGTFLPGAPLDPRMFSEGDLDRLIREGAVTVHDDPPATPKAAPRPARKVARKTSRRG